MINKKWLLVLALHLLTTLNSFSQKKTDQFVIRTIAFYNVENLFDTINNPDKNDESSPIMGLKGYKTSVYWNKINNIAKVISEIGKGKTNSSPVIMGLAEVENGNVLEDIIKTNSLKNQHYGIVHFESPDLRGIDVALLYQKKFFKPIDERRYELKIWDGNGRRIYTRDQLLVSGILDDELVHLIVNHWPSRRGGEAKSRPKREKAAWLTKKIIDEIRSSEPNAKIIIMGDLNDDPINSSLKKVLKTKGKIKNVLGEDIYNPMENMFKRGFNTLGYRDNLNLFDQIMITYPLLEKKGNYESYKFYQANIFNPSFITTKSGRFKGYPFRSFNNGGFTGGYSDHFPVYIYLIKRKH
jgi:hypothetical protein